MKRVDGGNRHDVKVGFFITTKSPLAMAVDNGKRFVDGVEKWRGKARGEVLSVEKRSGGPTQYEVKFDSDGKVLWCWHTDISFWEEPS